jgi:hypothetical protein
MEPVEYFFVPEEESIRLEHLLLPENLHNEELVENGP